MVLALCINRDLLAALGVDDTAYLTLTERKIPNCRALLSIYPAWCNLIVSYGKFEHVQLGRRGMMLLCEA
jgi:hypothetical protein